MPARSSLLCALAFALSAALPAFAQSVNTPEVEPNGGKPTATPLVRDLQNGDTLSGAGTVGDSDYFLLRTAPAAPGIYRHRVSVTQGLTGGGLMIQGLRTSNGQAFINGSDLPANDANLREIVWYGFGRSESLYMRVNNRGIDAYVLTYAVESVTPADLPTPPDGQPQRVTALMLGGARFALTALLYDSSFQLRTFNHGLEGTVQVPLPAESGVYYLALGLTNGFSLGAITNLPPGIAFSAIGFLAGGLESPDVVVGGRSIGGDPVGVSTAFDNGQGEVLNFTKPGPFDLIWLRITVASPCGQEWEGAAPPERYRHSMAYDSVRQRVVMFGGVGGTRTMDDTWEWDGQSWHGKFLPGPPAQNQINGLAPFAAMAFDRARARTVLYDSLDAKTWLYDGTAWTGIAAPGPGLRVGALAYDEARERVVHFVDTETWLWDGSAWTSVAAPGPSARRRHAMAYDAARQRVVLFGGAAISTGALNGETWTWDGATWTLAATTGPAPRVDHALVYDAARQRIVLIGGSLAPAEAVWEWDGSAWSLAVTSDTPLRNAATATYDEARQQIVLHGGAYSFNQTRSPIRSDTYTRTSGVWREAGVTPGARYRASMVFDPVRGQSVLYGGLLWTGSSGGGFGNPVFINFITAQDTWLWDGAVWARSEALGPGLRSGAAFAFDHTRGVSVLFGGALASLNSGGLLAPPHTWTFDGAAWTRAATAGPQARRSPSMAFDPASGRVLLFGGADLQGQPFGDTWVWDGSTWTNLRVPGPAPRAAASLATDFARQRVVLFGGASAFAPGGELGDTWEWDGFAWSPRAQGGPPARFDGSMDFDPVSKTVVLTGGGFYSPGSSTNNVPTAPPSDLWEWTGFSWHKRAAALPIATGGASMAYDSARSQLVIAFGVSIQSGGIHGATYTLNSTPSSITQQPQPLRALLGRTASFSVGGAFSGDTLYQWRRNGEPLVDGPGVTGANAPTLTLDPVRTSSEAVYDVVVSDRCGTSVSDPAQLIVACRADFNGDGAANPDDLMDYIACFFEAPPCPMADLNGDGLVDPDDMADFIMAYFSPCP